MKKSDEKTTLEKLLLKISGLTEISREKQLELIDLWYSLREEMSILQTLSTTDPLGEWNNRRGLEQDAEKIFSSFYREIYESIAIVVIDLDKFKPINDVHGHISGDKVLVKLASIIKSSVRGFDSFGRLGGDEFVIILPKSNKHCAGKVLERIKNKFDSTKFIFNDQKVGVSLTFGIATTEEGHEVTFEELLHEADLEMNLKKGGRNRD